MEEQLQLLPVEVVLLANLQLIMRVSLRLALVLRNKLKNFDFFN
jgi:hypothetical protein